MILIPELETVVILVPRTASSSLRHAIAERYPKSMMIYRHMEADGVPHGYNRWRKIGVVRHPIDRMWSLYKFLSQVKGVSGVGNSYEQRQRKSKEMQFSDWIVNNEIHFTDPFDSSGTLRYYPQYTVLHAMAENRKSQFVHLRPDLGTEIYHYSNVIGLCKELDLNIGEHRNETDCLPPPGITDEAVDYVRRVFEWDLRAVGATL